MDEGNDTKSQMVCGQVTNNEGNMLGWVVLRIPKTFLDSLMLKETTSNKHSISEEAYIIGNDYVMRSASRFDTVFRATINIKNPSTPDVFGLQQGIVNYTDYRGRDVLSAFSTLQTPGLQWAVMVEQDSYEAMHQVRVLYNQSLALIVLISAAFFVFVFFTSRRIVKPILNLRKAASALGDGNFEKELKIVSNDEIGDLTETFNNMAFKLKQQQTEIGKERFRRLRAMIDSQELERQRLSKELHEGIGQTLVALKFKTEQLIEKNGQDVTKEVAEIEKLSNGIIEQIRQISNNLAPMVLGEFGLVAAIRFLSDEIMTQSNIKILVETANLPPKITGKVRTYLFRIVQEALLNATKHSDAQWIKVSLLGEPKSIKLILSDNGKGFTANDAKTFGHGLHNMKERVELLNGRLKIESESGEGTTFTIIIPYIEPENGKNQVNLS
jgi:signal transduction histidine kinase